MAAMLRQQALRLYHGTNANFSAFDRAFAVTTGRASNGFLGIWLATTQAHAQIYGTTCLTVDAHVGKAENIAIGDLSAWHKEVSVLVRDIEPEQEAMLISREFYQRKRDTFLAAGIDTLLVQELDESVEIVIALRPENLTIVDGH